MPADETKPEVKKPEDKPVEKPTDVLGEIDGKPLTRADAAKAKDAKPTAKELSNEEHHAALTARVDVVAVKPKRVVKGRTFPEERESVKMVSLRCAVAHRVLHGCSPKEVEALKAAAPAKGGDAFDHWALRHIESKLDGVPEGELATQANLATFSQPAQVDALRKAAIDALAPA